MEDFSAETRTGSITNPAQTDSFTFNGDSGQTAVINMSRESESLHPNIFLYAPAGTLEISDWDGSLDEESGRVGDGSRQKQAWGVGTVYVDPHGDFVIGNDWNEKKEAKRQEASGTIFVRKSIMNLAT